MKVPQTVVRIYPNAADFSQEETKATEAVGKMMKAECSMMEREKQDGRKKAQKA